MVRDPSRPYVSLEGVVHRRTRWMRVGASLVAFLALILVLAVPLAVLAQAQSPRPLRVAPTELPDLEPEGVGDDGDARVAAGPINLIVDSDPGVDDAAAIIWLVSQSRSDINVAGIVTVAGNTDVDSATNNALLLLSWLGMNRVTVVRGADGPLEQIASKVNQLIHGPDGLWYVGLANPQDTSSVLTDAPTYYCTTLARPNFRGATVLALGPLTNLAASIAACPAAWAGVRIDTLGGAKFGGNQTPVSEFNYWYDPEAAEYVFGHALAYGYALEQIPEDAFDQFVLTGTDMTQLYTSANPAMANLLGPLTMYMCQLSQACAYDESGFPIVDANGVPILHQYDELGNATPIPMEEALYPPLPDPVAAIYALNGDLGTPQSALVKILAHAVPEYVRGQSVIGLSFSERVSMIVDDQEFNNLIDLAFTDPGTFFYELFLITSRDPDNATVVTDVAARRMINRFLRFVAVAVGRSQDASVTVDGTSAAPVPEAQNTLLLPMVID